MLLDADAGRRRPRRGRARGPGGRFQLLPGHDHAQPRETGRSVHNGDYGRGYTPGGIDAGDLDGDGDLDVAYGNGTSDVTVVPNNGNGTFGPHGGQAVHHNPRGLKMADFDADGDLDIVTSNNYSQLHLAPAQRRQRDVSSARGLLPRLRHHEPRHRRLRSRRRSRPRGRQPRQRPRLDPAQPGEWDVHEPARRARGERSGGRGPRRPRRRRPAGPGRHALGELSGRRLPERDGDHPGRGRRRRGRRRGLRARERGGLGSSRGRGRPAPGRGAADAVELERAGRPGAAVPRFDVLRSAAPADFTAATCVENGGADRVASDGQVPASLFAYLVRVRNACGGNAGSRSDGTPRTAALCP